MGKRVFSAISSHAFSSGASGSIMIRGSLFHGLSYPVFLLCWYTYPGLFLLFGLVLWMRPDLFEDTRKVGKYSS
jgi:hypothetical protein